MNKTFLGHFVIADETVDINLFYYIILSSKLQYIDCTCHSAWLNKALNFIKNASYNLSVLNGVYKKLLKSLNSLVKTSSQTMVDMYTGNVVILFHQIELHGISTYGSFKGPFTLMILWHNLAISPQGEQKLIYPEFRTAGAFIIIFPTMQLRWIWCFWHF